MANLPESPTWESGVYQIEVTDPVQGGVNGVTNTPLKQLVNRTAFLKAQTNLIPGIQTQLNTASNDVQLIRGAGAVIKQAVVTGRHNTSGVPNFITFVQGQGVAGNPHVYTIHASASEPLVVTASGGFRANAPALFYMRFTSDIVLNLTNNFAQLVVARWNETTGEAQIFLTQNVGYTIGYQFPTSPTAGEYFYSLRDERMYLRGGSVWAAVNDVVLASSIPNSAVPAEQIALAPTIGIGIKDLYGRSTVPAGTIHTFAGTIANIPAGFILCAGSAVSRTVFSDLFRAIGTTYGVGDGSTTFNLPDLRGEFIRGLDAGRGVDSGRALGSAQGHQFQDHQHFTNFLTSINTTSLNGVVATTSAGALDANSLSRTASTGNFGSETRPRNIAMNFIIKF
jgi:microcystin-dependent protein